MQYTDEQRRNNILKAAKSDLQAFCRDNSDLTAGDFIALFSSFMKSAFDLAPDHATRTKLYQEVIDALIAMQQEDPPCNS